MILYIHSELWFTREMAKRQHAIECQPRFVSFIISAFAAALKNKSLVILKQT